MLAHGDLIAVGIFLLVICTVGVCSLPNPVNARTELERKQNLAWKVFEGMCSGKIVPFKRRGV